MTEDSYIFEGLKVLDVSSWIAAPVAATVFADLGADVIKIEAPETGDAYRNYALFPMTPNADVNYTWLLDARNKRSLSLNLKSAEGMEILRKLISDCDIYITNQPLPLRRVLKLEYEDLKPLNKRMIYASLTAYGEEGPDRDNEAFDLVAYWSRSGLMDRMRTPGSEPRQALPGLGDHPSGIALYAGIVTALLKRERTGEGTRVHTSLLANGMWSISCLGQAAFCQADFSTIPGQRMTTALYEASDGRWIQLSMIRTAEDFDRLMVCLDSIELLTDERFLTPELRMQHAEPFTAALRAIFTSRDSDEWMQLFRDADLPIARVAEVTDLPNDPQVLINNMAVEPVEDLGVERIIKDPINVDNLKRVGPKKPPQLGEHNNEILSALGFDDTTIASLAERGII